LKNGGILQSEASDETGARERIVMNSLQHSAFAGYFYFYFDVKVVCAASKA
jgi:hypothetical protein